MRIDCYLTHQSCPEEALVGTYLIVIDVLRATSTIISALAAGARAVIPTVSVEAAYRLREEHPELLLIGERNGLPLPGFDHGNSPRNLEQFSGKTLVACTTNGTKALHKARYMKSIWLAALINRQAVVRRLLQVQPERCLILCSGTEDRYSLDDTLAAGAILAGLGEVITLTEANCNDAALTALWLFERWGDNPEQLLRTCHHGQKLLDLGFDEDIAYCAQLDICPLVPYLDSETGQIRA